MKAWLLLDKYYPSDDPAREILFAHSRAVAAKALTIAGHLTSPRKIDFLFIEEAAILHDIGIRFVHAPKIGCHGLLPYIAHGYKGRELLESEGLPKLALVCERHIGVGISAEEIIARHLPLPIRDMIPVTIEERIIAYSDLFFSKGELELAQEKELHCVRESVARFGTRDLATFDQWHTLFTA